MELRGAVARRALGVLLFSCVVLLASVPAALAIEAPGSISGEVTDQSHKPLANIEVSVYGASGAFVAFATTEASGKYKVEGLPKGEYKVEFSPEFEGGLNYVTQFYKNQSSFTAAEKVVVEEGKTTEKIDAELELGGQIEGTVTEASTHKALSGMTVVALGPGEVVDERTLTRSGGRYTIHALAPGTYKIGFAGTGYVTQYYNNQPTFALATPLTVERGGMLAGIDAALMPKAPINTAAPVASGTPAAGQTLSCTTGSWTGTPAPAFAYAWLRDGVAIPGASTSTYVVQAADQGNGLTCKVTAKNASGTVAALSNTLTVPIPPPPPPVITLLSSRLGVLGGAARVPIACASANCAGTIELTEQVVVRHRHGHRRIRRTLVLGSAPYALAVGHSATVPVGLSATARRVLAVAKHHRLAARIAVSVIGGAAKGGSVVLIGPAPRRKHRHR